MTPALRHRFKFFTLHLTGSAVALTLVLGGLYLGWYRWPGWYLTDARHVLGLVVLIDLIVGPTLTFTVAAPAKPRAVLARDMAVILTAQTIALAYGAGTLWEARPLYYTFSVDRLELVQASELNADEIARARRENPSLAPYWYSLPRWVWAPLPSNAEAASQIVKSAALGGTDVIQMPRYFRPWQQAQEPLRAELASIDEAKGLFGKQRQAVKARMVRLGLSTTDRNVLMLMGARPVAAVFDPATMRRLAVIGAN